MIPFSHDVKKKIQHVLPNPFTFPLLSVTIKMGCAPSKASPGSRPARASGSLPARPLAHQTVRLWALRAICAVAEGADLRTDTANASDLPSQTVAAVLGDAQHRVAALGGRTGMPRSIGTVYGGLIVLFLGTEFRGAEKSILAQPPPVNRTFYTGY